MFVEKTKSILNFSDTVTTNAQVASNKDITKDPFTVLLTGENEGLADTIILMSVNPISMKITMTSTEIKNSFKEIGQLAVEEYNFTNVGKFSQDNMSAFGISIPFTDKSFLMTYSGVCKAGIKDISEINIEVNQAEKKVIVDLPNVEVLDTYIDVNSIEVYDQSFNPINQITVNDVKNFQANETAKAEELAIKNGLLDKAKVRMEEVVKSQVKMLLSNTEQSEYEIVINWK